jgi:hypothetical protein
MAAATTAIARRSVTPPTAIGTARASAGGCIATAANARPSGHAAIPSTVHTEK